MKLRYHFIITIMLLCLGQSSFAQMQTLQREVESIVADKNLKLGLSIYDFQTGKTLSINGNKRFPMQSVYKFQIGLAVLNNVDNGICTLSDTIVIEKKDLHPELWSPIRDTYPNGVSMPLSNVITYAVAQSDNSASDLLLSILGGPDKVQNYIQVKGIRKMHIKNTEREIQSSWDLQFQNWTTPNEMIKLLTLFNNEKLLQSNTHHFIWQVMLQTKTGSIRNLLPPDATVAHKTGHSGKGNGNITAANNDVGIFIFPDGRRIAFAIFITDSSEPSETNYTVIAQLGLAIYQNFLQK